MSLIVKGGECRRITFLPSSSDIICAHSLLPFNMRREIVGVKTIESRGNQSQFDSF